MPNISAVNINYTSFRGVIGDLFLTANNYDYFEIELWNSNASTFYYAQNWTDSSTNNYSYTDFSGLSQGTTYTIKGFVKSSGGSRTHVGTMAVTTLSPSPPSGVGTISVTPSENSLFISWGNASNVESYALEVRVGNSGGSLVYNNYSLLSTSETVSGLTSGTTYHIKVYAINSQGNGSPSITTASTSSPPNPRPSNWSWNTLVSDGMIYSYGGLLRANICDSTEWTDFCDRVNEFRVYKNLSSYNFTPVSSYGSITSGIFNEVSTAISQMASAPSTVGTGETGTYSKISELSNSLNSIV